MEQIIHTYGKALMVILVTAILCVWIFCGMEDETGNRGILRIVGKK